MIYKFFLRKGSVMLKINGFLPKKIGNREKESKWAPLISNVTLIATIMAIIDMWIKFIQQEAEKIH